MKRPHKMQVLTFVENEQPPVFRVPPSVLKIAEVEKDIQYGEKIENPKSPKETHFGSLVAELAFGGMLHEKEIPHIRNPVFYHERETPWREYDFLTPVGSIDIKAITYEDWKKRLIIPKERWDKLSRKCDIVAAFKFLDEEYRRVELRGYILGSKVQSLKVAEPPSTICPDEPGYWAYLKDLTDGTLLWDRLKTCRKLPFGGWGPHNLR